jgi:hypothetical protein
MVKWEMLRTESMGGDGGQPDNFYTLLSDVPLAYLFLNAILCSSSKLPNGYSVSQRHF